MDSKALLDVGFNLSLFEELTPREQAFVMHPEVFTDPVAAAVAAGYAESTAKVKAHTMRKQLMHYIKPVAAARMEAMEVSYDSLVYELRCIAYAKSTDYLDTVDVEGDTVKAYKDISRLPDHMQRAIKTVEFETVIMADGTQFQKIAKVELHDKQAAIKQLREMGCFDGSKPTEDGEHELFEYLEPNELGTIEALYAKAAARVRAAKDRAQDARAITVTNGRKAKAKDSKG